MNHEKLVNEPDKVLFVTTYLTGPAFDWFEPFVRDYQIHDLDDQDDDVTPWDLSLLFLLVTTLGVG
jgi:hypothetical protein